MSADPADHGITLPPGGRFGGITGWLLTPDDLDHLNTFTTDPPEEQQAEPIDASTLGLLTDPTPEEAHQPAQRPVEDRHRPLGDTWPEDGITLTYGELRRLLALHLTQLAHTMPRHQPWLYAEAAAQAMQDGETPLRLREVLE